MARGEEDVWARVGVVWFPGHAALLVCCSVLVRAVVVLPELKGSSPACSCAG